MANAVSIYKRVMKELATYPLENKWGVQGQATILAACIIAEAIRNESEVDNNG